MSSRWLRSSTIIWEEMDGAAVLVNTRSKKTFVLNATASFIWKCCDGSLSVDCVAKKLVRATGSELRRVHEQIAQFCQEMQTNGLLQPAIASSASGGVSNFSFHGKYLIPAIKLQNSSIGFRGRPSSRGISGPG